MKAIRISALSVILIAASVASTFAAPPGTLQVGAARVDITPAPDAALPMGGYAERVSGFTSIHDHIYARAIVISDGTHQAALLAWELVAMPNQVWEAISARVSKELGIPADNVILAAVHDHSAPTPAYAFGRPPAPGAPANPAFKPPSAETIAYTTKIENDAFEAIRQAKANLQPARFAFGTGKAYVNINRVQYFPQKEWFWLGYNPDGPSDKTVAVVKFSDLSGKPIAFFINYAVHAVVMGGDNLAITGELSGATSRYVEQFYQGKIVKPGRGNSGLRESEVSSGDGPVAIWTSGAAGDQNPIVRDRAPDFSMVDAFGRILGEETVRVSNSMGPMASAVDVGAAQRVISCPGRKWEPGTRPRAEYKWEDSDPVNIRLSLLRLNGVAFAGISGEVFTHIYEHLQRDSPLKTIMVTHANGSSGYIPSDDSFVPIAYEVTTSHLKPGCAENAIVNGFLEMMAAH